MDNFVENMIRAASLKCPFCGSENTELDHHDLDADIKDNQFEIFVPFVCDDCHLEWSLVYRVAGYLDRQSGQRHINEL